MLLHVYMVVPGPSWSLLVPPGPWFTPFPIPPLNFTMSTQRGGDVKEEREREREKKRNREREMVVVGEGEGGGGGGGGGGLKVLSKQ